MGFGFVGRRAKKTPGKIPSAVKARSANRRAERGVFSKSHPQTQTRQQRPNSSPPSRSHAPTPIQDTPVASKKPLLRPPSLEPQKRHVSGPEMPELVQGPPTPMVVRAEAQLPMSSEPIAPFPSSGILVSAILSIHNRSLLFRRALDGYMMQTLPPENWEILLLDDMSTEDLRKTYRHLIGRVNIRHILIDHTRHPVFQQRNPGWERGMEPSWYHTPAISMNMGFSMAKGRVLCLCHPEILHAPSNFERAVARLRKERVFAFGTTWLGNSICNEWLSRNSWTEYGWAGFLARVNAKSLRKFSPKELYWYTSFLTREAAIAVRGVDFAFLNGVAGEDDDFKERVRNAGWIPVHAPDIEGFHQDHSHEKEAHHRRDTAAWRLGLKTNRALFKERTQQGFPAEVNQGLDWTASACVVDVIEHVLQ